MYRRRLALLAFTMCSASVCTSCEGDRRPASVEVRTDVKAVDPRPAQTEAAAVLPSFDALAARGLPALVTIHSHVELEPEAPGDVPRVLRGTGSGVLVARDGLILTNDHVLGGSLEGAREVRLHDGRTLEARVVARDERYDLALLALTDPPDGLTTLPLSSRSPRPGEWAIALGHPLGLGDTVSLGIVSGLGRTFREAGAPRGLIQNGVWHFIQTDMSLNVGNSGGPLLDARGEIIGLNTVVMRSGQGLAFAIPAPLIRHFVHELRTHGAARHPRIDAVGRTDPSAVTPHGGGAVVLTEVRPEGAAARAGLRAGDRIFAVNDHRTPRLEDLIYHLELSGVGNTASLKVARPDSPTPLNLSLTPEARQ